MILKSLNSLLKPKKKELEKEYATPKVSGVRNISDKFALSGLTPQRMAAIIKAAKEGQPDDLLTIAEEIEEADAHYRSVLSTRKLAIRKLKPSIEYKGEDKKTLEMVEFLEAQIQRPDFLNIFGDMLDALTKGYSMIEMVWNTQETPWIVEKFIWRDPRLFMLSAADQSLRIKDDNKRSGQEIPAHKFITHMPRLKSGSIGRNGLAMPLVWSYLFKNYSIKDWAAFVEIYGVPVRMGTYGADASDEDIDELIKSVVNIGTDACAVFPENMKLDIIQSSNQSGNAEIFQSMAEYMDKQISKLILGQTMTSDDGSSRSQAQVHDGVRNDLLEADGQDIAYSINEHYIKPLIQLNFGDVGEIPVFKLQLIEFEDIKAKLEAVKALVPLGLPISKAQIYKDFGLHAPEGEDDVLSFGQGDVAANRLSNSLNMAFNGQEKAPEQVENLADGIGEDFLSDWVDQSEGLIEPILSLAKSTNSYEEFLEELKEIKLDSQPLQDGIQKANMVARAFGDVQDSPFEKPKKKL